jgi:AraC-like DNA-binding protein
MAERPRQVLFETPLVAVGAFHCWPGDERWREVNVVPAYPLVVFPGTSVVIEHVGREPVLANPNHVMFYSRGDEYVRRLHDGRGDHCVYFALKQRLAEQLLGGDSIPFVHGPGEPDVYLLQTELARALRVASPDPLAVEERALEIVDRAIGTAAAYHSRPRTRRRGRTERDHYELAEAAKRLLTETYTERMTLDELARCLHTSGFHLARVFRTRTGFSLHGYRNQLRLRSALERLYSPHCDLASLAHELGFSNHSHFTGAFRAAFGVPPSALREARTKLEARLRARS